MWKAIRNGAILVVLAGSILAGGAYAGNSYPGVGGCPQPIRSVWPDHLEAAACEVAWCESRWDVNAYNTAGPYYSWFQTDIEAYGHANAQLAYGKYWREWLDNERGYPWPNCRALVPFKTTGETSSIVITLPQTGAFAE